MQYNMKVISAEVDYDALYMIMEYKRAKKT